VVVKSGTAQKTKYKFGDYIQFGRVELDKGNYSVAIKYLNNAVKHRPASYEGYYLRGMGKYHLEDYIGAESDFTESMKYDPFNSEIYHFRAIVRSSQYNLGGALTDYARAIKLNPKNPLFYVNRARALLFLQEYDSAIADCNRTIELKYRKEDVYLIRGMSYRELDQYQNALADFNNAIKKNPDNTYNYVQRGLLYVDRNQPDSAIIDFNHALSINADDSFALFQRGLARIEISDTTGAFDDLNKVIELAPRNSYAYYNRAILWLGNNNDKAALEDLNRVVSLNPENIMVYLYRGKVKVSMNNPEDAIADFDKAISIYPEFADAYYERSRAKKQLQDYDGAEQDYQMAYTMNAFNFQRSDSLKLQEEMYIRRLMTLSGDFDDTENHDRRLQNQNIDIEIKPEYSTILFATSLEKVVFYDTYSNPYYNSPLLSLSNDENINNSNLATKELVKYIDTLNISNSDWEINLKLAELYQEVKDYNNALKHFDKVILLNPECIRAWFGRANTRLKLIGLMELEFDRQQIFEASSGDNKNDLLSFKSKEKYTLRDVLTDYNKALDLDPDFYFALYNRANVKSKLGNYWGAVSDYTEVIQINPTFSNAHFNKGLILIILNLKTLGCKDISQAGELGVDDAYVVLKRFCTK